VINYIDVLKSDTSDPLGTWSDHGNVEHDGKKIEGESAFIGRSSKLTMGRL